MDAFFHLYLGHLFGDYVLQNGWIARNKGKRKSVLFLHAFLVFLSHLVFALGIGFGIFQFLSILTIGVIHYLLDSMKIRFFPTGWRGYIFDQLLHAFTVFVFSWNLTNVSFFLPEWITIRLALSIFNAYLIGILFHTVFNNDKAYRRDFLGYVYRGAVPWMGNFWIFGVLLFPMIEILYRWRKDTVYSNVTSLLITILWEVLS